MLLGLLLFYHLRAKNVGRWIIYQVYIFESGNIKYLLVRNLSGVYGFPKGHVEDNETEEETAIREVFEETGVKVTLIPGFKEEEMRLVVKKEKALKEVKKVKNEWLYLASIIPIINPIKNTQIAIIKKYFWKLFQLKVKRLIRSVKQVNI